MMWHDANACARARGRWRKVCANRKRKPTMTSQMIRDPLRLREDCYGTDLWARDDSLASIVEYPEDVLLQSNEGVKYCIALDRRDNRSTI
jgi:hypothetical protein